MRQLTTSWATVLPVFLACVAHPAWGAPPARPGQGRAASGPPHASRGTLHGTATYYASKFNGRLTSNGERHDPDAHTAAHRTLPFGTRLLVTNLVNDKSVVVVINDRGPWIKRRMLDLSQAAARELDFMKAGVVLVRAEILHERLTATAGPDPDPAPPTTAPAEVLAKADPLPAAPLPAPATIGAASAAFAILPGAM